MATVYLVSSGSYSDYSIDAAFSTQEKAQEFVDHANGPDGEGYRIEEMELDAPRETWPGSWMVWIDSEGVVQGTMWTSGSPNAPPVHSQGFSSPVWGTTPEKFYGHGPTEEHARRSAEELRRVTLVLGSAMPPR